MKFFYSLRFAFYVLPLIIYLLTGLFSVPSVYAQAPIQSGQTATGYNTPNTTTDVKPGLHTYAQSVIIETAAAFVCMLGGVDPITADHKCLTVTAGGKIGYAKDNQNMGINRFFANSIAMLYTNMPAHTNDYIAYLTNNFNPLGAKKAYAAQPNPCTNGCTGIDKLFPIQDIWIVIRNLAYLLMVIAFMLVGMAIMFRVKIDPRTVMTIENQLPKLILGLLAITFSFAIAGVMIDLMNILINLLYNIFIGIPNINPAQLTPNTLITSTPFDAANAMVPPTLGGSQLILPKLPALNIGQVALDALKNIQGNLINAAFPPGAFFQAITSILSAVVLNGLSWAASGGTIVFGNSNGMAHIATYGAISFGRVLEQFFKLSNYPQPNTNGITSFIFGTLDPTYIFDNFRLGSPVGFILDTVSYILSLSISNNIAGPLRDMSIDILGNGGGVIGNLVYWQLMQGMFPSIFNYIDLALRQWAPYILIWLIIYIAIFLAMARLFFSLVFTWATILFQIILAPILIIFGAVPGIKGAGFIGWLRSLSAHLLAFPITIGIFFLGNAMLQKFFITPDCTNLANITNPAAQAQAIANAHCFVPPLIGGGALPVGLLMALTTIFAASNGPQIAKDLLEEKDNKNFGAFQQTSGAGLQSVYKAGKATVYGFGKTPTPGARGGALTAFGQL